MKKLLTIISLFIVPAMCCLKTASAQTQPRGFVYIVNKLTLTYQDKNFEVDAKTLAGWRGLTRWSDNSLLQARPSVLRQDLETFFGLTPETQTPDFRFYHFQLDKIYDYLQTSIATSTDQALVEPRLNIENNRAADFSPPQNGRRLDAYQSTLDIAKALEQNQDAAALTVNETLPVKNLADTNNLGVNQLVAEGVSSFKGSPKNRRFNIAAGVKKLQGVLVAPGATFSFDDNLGPVDGEHGFLPELVIKGKEGTIPEFGGGLCQVSTTTFRAAMNAGVPITARRNHAYAVQYYSPQGTDATIYPGSADLRFINDTPGYILIWPYEKGKNTLVFDFYGSKDNRQVVLDKPDVYDRRPDGSMKATWTRHVTNNGVTRDDVFKSTYQSPALFHKQEQFVSATGSPGSGLNMSKIN